MSLQSESIAQQRAKQLGHVRRDLDAVRRRGADVVLFALDPIGRVGQLKRDFPYACLMRSIGVAPTAVKRAPGSILR
jgi:hypothetical protein